MSLFDSLFNADKSGKAASLFAEDSTFAVRRQAEASEPAADSLAVKQEQHLKRKHAVGKRGEPDAPTEPLTRQQAPAGQPADPDAPSENPKKLRKGKPASAAQAAAAVPVPAQVAASDAPPGKKRKRDKAAAESAVGRPAQPATEGPAKQSKKRQAERAAEPAGRQQVQATAPGPHAGHSAEGRVKGVVEHTGPQALTGKAVTGAHAEAQRPAKRAKHAAEPPVGQQAQAAAELPAAQHRSKQLRAAVKAARAAAADDEGAGADQLASADGGGQRHQHAGEAALAAADAAADRQPSAAAGSGEQRLKLTPEEEAERLQRTAFVGNLPIAIKKRTLLKHFGRYGQIESLRLRSVPVKLDGKKMPRRAAVLTGSVSTKRGTANAYIVFVEAESVGRALASNMQLLEGLHMRVDRAAPPCQEGSAGGSVHYERGRSAFVGNLPFDVECMSIILAKGQIGQRPAQLCSCQALVENTAEFLCSSGPFPCRDEEVIALFSTAAAKLGMEHGIEAVRIVRDPTSNLGKGFGFVLFSSQPALRAALSLNDAKLRNRPVRVTKVVKIPDHLKGGLNKAGRKPNKGAVRRMSSGHGKGGTSHAVRAVPKLQSSAGGPSSWQGFKTKGAKKTSAPLNIKSKPRTSAKPGPSKAGKGLKFQTKAGKESRFQRKQ